MSSRTYGDAINTLNSLQSNKATLDAVKASGGRLSQYAIPEMVEYLQRIGYTTGDLNQLNVIHITGTKGKGSTCAFVNSLLCKAKPEWKIGLYTSPHMVAVRERVRINGKPLSEEDFTKFFFEVWDRLDANPQRENPDTPPKPMYFRFMTLVAFHAFLTLKVNATILEVGVGGTYDSTNIVPKPIVTGITSLGFDHQGVLGKTLPEIAWQKAGIYKEGVPAFTVDQPKDALQVIRERAEELKASRLTVVPATGLSGVKLGLAGIHQVSNACLAVQLVQSFLNSHESIQPEATLSEVYIDGLKSVTWPGRCQTVADPTYSNITWFLDGAHTAESLECCISWFVSPGVGLPENDSSRKHTRVLVFNITHGRSGTNFMTVMDEACQTQLKLHSPNEDPTTFFDHVIFCTNITFADGHSKSDLTVVADPERDLVQLNTQKELASAWATLRPTFPISNIHLMPTIQHAVSFVKTLKSEAHDHKIDVLVTGSLHLVGGLIEAAGLNDVAL